MIERVPVACPYCSSDAVTRMYIATVRLDSCECR
ncbi:MAG: hypothetical protein JWM05_3222, partial [Acidimicrobiales bacterium]|nr:hypothetical protein [Acidimicrobiales bacterium]